MPYKFTLALLCIFTPFTSAQSQKVTLITHWIPQAQFAGYYMAYEKGFFSKYGLDVTIKNIDVDKPNEEELTKGNAEFITSFLSTAIMLSDQYDLVNIGQTSRKSALVFVAKAKSGIKSINQLKGKKIGIWAAGFQEIPRAFIAGYDLNVKFVPIRSTINLFIEGGVDLMTVMWYNEYNSIINAGIDEEDMSAFFFSDYGMDVPEDGIYTTRKFHKENKTVCENFVKAVMEGWNYAKENRKETLDNVIKRMKEARIPANYSHQSWMLDKVLKLIFPEGMSNNGKLKKSEFDFTYKILKDSGYVKKTLTYEEFIGQ